MTTTRRMDETQVLVTLAGLAAQGYEPAESLRARFREKQITQDQFMEGARHVVDAQAGSAAQSALQEHASPTRAPVPAKRGGRTAARFAPAGGERRVDGFMFFCSKATEGECFRRSLFGIGQQEITVGPGQPASRGSRATHASPRAAAPPDPRGLCLPADQSPPHWNNCRTRLLRLIFFFLRRRCTK